MDPVTYRHCRRWGRVFQPTKGTTMSTIGAVGGVSSAWSDYGSSRANAMKERLFAKVDSDSSGSVDKTELQSMLDHMATQGGSQAASADDWLGKMDSNGDGSLDSSELDAGMKSLMPPPSSTVDFAQQRAGGSSAAVDDLFSKLDSDASGGLAATELNQLLDQIATQSGLTSKGSGSTSSSSTASQADAAVFSALDSDGDGSVSKAEFKAALSGGTDGTAQAGGPPPPPPPPAGAASSGSASSASGTSSSSSATDPLDTNGDGVVSAQERAAGEIAALMKTLVSAMDSDGDQSVSASEASSFGDKLGAALQTMASQQSTTASDSGSQAGSEPAARGGRGLDLTALSELVRREYGQAAASSLSVAV
jgi:Ca2+-binding EF-hand superfamily protein